MLTLTLKHEIFVIYADIKKTGMDLASSKDDVDSVLSSLSQNTTIRPSEERKRHLSSDEPTSDTHTKKARGETDQANFRSQIIGDVNIAGCTSECTETVSSIMVAIGKLITHFDARFDHIESRLPDKVKDMIESKITIVRGEIASSVEKVNRRANDIVDRSDEKIDRIEKVVGELKKTRPTYARYSKNISESTKYCH